jgi:hypothetical protein
LEEKNDQFIFNKNIGRFAKRSTGNVTVFSTAKPQTFPKCLFVTDRFCANVDLAVGLSPGSFTCPAGLGLAAHDDAADLVVGQQRDGIGPSG